MTVWNDNAARFSRSREDAMDLVDTIRRRNLPHVLEELIYPDRPAVVRQARAYREMMRMFRQQLAVAGVGYAAIEGLPYDARGPLPADLRGRHVRTLNKAARR